jgi:iron complex transport system ATP-binding protein
VHVLCGGGAGGPVLKAITDAGYGVSTGVLNVLDSDFENAKDLHIPTVPEVPFAAVSDGAHEENLRLVRESETVVVSPFPVGPGNFRNLEAARYALQSGKRVIVLMPGDPSSVDFVGGRASEAIKGLISSGAIEVKSLDEALKRLGGPSG